MEQDGAVPGEPQSNLEKLTGEINKVKAIIMTNMNNLLERERNLDELQEVSENMQQEASIFKKISEKVATTYRRRNVKLVVVIVVVVVVVLIVVLIIILLATGVIPFSAPVPSITPTGKP